MYKNIIVYQYITAYQYNYYNRSTPYTNIISYQYVTP